MRDIKHHLLIYLLIVFTLQKHEHQTPSRLQSLFCFEPFLDYITVLRSVRLLHILLN